MAIPKFWMTVQHWVLHLSLRQLAIGLPQPFLMLPRCSFPVYPLWLFILTNVRTATCLGSWILGQLLLNMSLTFHMLTCRVPRCLSAP
ncbi:hypothetical protein BJY52DRAFT_1308926 [Lactarius psammicola]|nr:hypothetical protein BJY52DRAFT_1308926 [Lactarius psammicola]